MEYGEEFQSLLSRLLLDAKRKLNISDKTIAYILLREGLNYYLKEISEGEFRDIKKHDGVQ